MRKTVMLVTMVGLTLYLGGVLVALRVAERPVFETIVPKTGTGALSLDNGGAAIGRTARYAELPVVASDGEFIGRVARVTENPAGRISWLHVETGGFLGLGGRTVKIHPGLYAIETNRIRIALSPGEIERLPEVRHGAR